MIMNDATKDIAAVPDGITHGTQSSAKCSLGDIVGLLVFELVMLWLMWPMIRALYRVM